MPVSKTLGDQVEIDTELLTIVSENLDFLTDHWNTDIDDPSLRRGTAILRSFLIDKQLAAAAGMLGHQIFIMGPDPQLLKEYVNDPVMTFYQACGGKFKNAELRSFSGTNRSLSPEEIKDHYDKYLGLHEWSHRVRLAAFMRQTSFKFGSIKINREEVIKYFANKRGGVHYDPSRNIKADQKKAELETKFTLLDRLYESRVLVAGKSAVYYELLGIGQQIVNSGDTQSLRGKIKSLLADLSRA